MKRYILPLLVLILLSAVNPSHTEKHAWKLLTGHSEVYWHCDKHWGYTHLKSGELYLDDEEQLRGRFDFDMQLFEVKDLDSQQYGTAKTILENTLKNEFFEIEKYPEVFFVLENVEALNDSLYRFQGDLTMHGNTVCISFPGKIYRQGDTLKWESGKFKIDRTDWGIYRLSPKHPYPDDEHGWTVPDTVEIQIRLAFLR